MLPIETELSRLCLAPRSIHFGHNDLPATSFSAAQMGRGNRQISTRPKLYIRRARPTSYCCIASVRLFALCNPLHPLCNLIPYCVGLLAALLLMVVSAGLVLRHRRAFGAGEHRRATAPHKCIARVTHSAGRLGSSNATAPTTDVAIPYRRAVRGSRSAASIRCQAAQGGLTVAITGATGVVGTRLTAKLAAQGHKVRVLTRDVNGAKAKLAGTATSKLEYFGPAQWAESLRGASGVVNLAGEPIATRWTPELKALIKSSRVNTTKSLATAMRGLPTEQRPKVLVSASAVGFYGTSDAATFNEDSAPGNDYLAEVREKSRGAGCRGTAPPTPGCLQQRRPTCNGRTHAPIMA